MHAINGLFPNGLQGCREQGAVQKKGRREAGLFGVREA